MKNRVFAGALTGVLLWGASLFADPIVWNTDLIPLPPSASAGVNVIVTLCSGPESDEVVAAWGDINTYAPYYSIFNNGTWSTAEIPIGSSVGVYNNVYVAAGPSAGSLVATWNDSNTNFPYYSVYNAGTWSAGAPIPLTAPIADSDGAYNDVFVAPGPGAGEVTAVWTNIGAHRLYYSIYSGGTWTTAILTSNSNFLGQYDVFLTPGPSAGELVATWVNNDTLRPSYSIYSSGAWSAPAILNPSGTQSIWNVICTTNPENGEVTAVWPDSNTATVYTSTYSGGMWSAETPIPLGTSIGCDRNAYIAAEVTGQLVVTWANSMTRVPYFSVFDNGVWSPGDEIPLSTSTGTTRDVTIACIEENNVMVAAWGDNVYPDLPYYSTFAGPTPPTPPVTAPLPPTNGQSAHIKNRFALLLEWTNQLNWTASTSSNVTGYNIKRNGVVIATNVTGTTYSDSNVPRKGTDVYLITSVNAEGTESLTALEITVTNL